MKWKNQEAQKKVREKEVGSELVGLLRPPTDPLCSPPQCHPVARVSSPPHGGPSSGALEECWCYICKVVHRLSVFLHLFDDVMDTDCSNVAILVRRISYNCS